jgi:hypothetical protein
MDDKTTMPTPDENGVYTLDLKYPKTVKFRSGNQEREETFSQLTVRRMTGGDIRAIANLKNEGDQMREIICRLAGISAPVFDALDAEDIAEVGTLIESFLPASLRMQLGGKT